MSLNSKSKEKLGQAGRSEEPKENEVAALPLTEIDPSSTKAGPSSSKAGPSSTKASKASKASKIDSSSTGVGPSSPTGPSSSKASNVEPSSTKADPSSTKASKASKTDSSPTGVGPSSPTGPSSSKASKVDSGSEEADPSSTKQAHASPPPPEASRKYSLDLDFSMLRLDSITSKEPTARIILYPRVPELDVSPYRGAGCYDNWVEVQLADCPEGSESARVLVVTPNSEEVGCTITHDRVSFHLYLDPGEDRLIFQNACTYQALSVRLETKSVKVGPNAPVFLYKGSCAIEASGITLVEFEILPRPSWEIAAKLATKRPAPESDSPSPKRVKRGESTYRAIEPARGMQAVSDGNALLRLEKGDIMSIGADDEGYRLTRHRTIAEQPNSSVWRAEHSGIPGGTIVVKIIRRTGRSERDTLQAIRAWIHESEIHSSLKSHPAILCMLGSDARFHSIYTEHIEAESLLCQRTPRCNRFMGYTSDTRRILADMASALAFVHDNNIVHNDIKPGNILYSPSRGAVLIDFGLSFWNGHPSPGGGSPWYLPPEFMVDWTLRGPPSDIWALGIVLLWVLGRIPLPERTPHWLISNIHLSPHMEDVNTMTQWLRVVQDICSKLNQDDPLDCIVRDLLELRMLKRIDAATLNKRLAEEGLLQDGKVE